MRMQLTQGRRAFSRSDLMILMGIGALLASVLYPTVTRVRRQRAVLACIQNIKQVGVASQMWLHDFEDRFPWVVPVKEGGSLGLALVSDHLRCLSNHLQTPKVVSCPGLVRHRPPADSWSRFQEGNVGYALMPDMRVIMASDRTAPALSQALVSDMDLEGGRTEFCARCQASVMAFDLGKPGGALGPIRWSKTNHVDRGSLTLVDGTVVMVDNEGIRRQASLTKDQGNSLHLLLPK